jgi:hypothetical protein
LERETWTAVDFEDDDDIFGKNKSSSTSHSPSPQPIYSLRSSPQPIQTNSSCSTASVAANDNVSNNDENLTDARSLFVDHFYAEAPQEQTSKQSKNQMRSFNIDQRGKIVDCGFKIGRQSRPLTSKHFNY